MAILCEVCVETVDDASRAEQSGADRIELCADLAVGGTTPSAGLMRETIRTIDIPVMTMIRPRPGDFCFADSDVQVMISDIRNARECGAEGVVIGALTDSAQIDLEICQQLVAAAEGLDITFHRAFDRVAEPLETIDVLCDLAVSRILTSGQALSADAGQDALRCFVEHARGRCSIMPGAGINAENVREILDMTGAHEVHFSGSQKVSGPDEFGTRYVTDSARIARICERAKNR